MMRRPSMSALKPTGLTIVISCVIACSPGTPARSGQASLAQTSGRAAATEVTADDLRAEAEAISRRAQLAGNPKPDATVPLGPRPLLERNASNALPPTRATDHAQTRGGELVAVVVDSKPTPLGAQKAATPGDEPTPFVPPPLTLGFAGDERSVAPGLDQALLSPTPDARQRGFTYAFLFVDEYLSDSLERELALVGVQVLGPHGGAWKVRVPTDPARLQAIAAQRHVTALVYAATDQKLDLRVRTFKKRFAGELDALPVVVNTFDKTALENVASWLKPRAIVGPFDTALLYVMAVVPLTELDALARLDGVLWVELSAPGGGGHDESMPVMGMDYIRPGGDGRRYSGATTILGILDSGFMIGDKAKPQHDDLAKFGCGLDVTEEQHGVWNDEAGHGTHVLATAIGTGAGDPRYQGAAPDVGHDSTVQIRAAKIWNFENRGTEAEELAGGDFMGVPSDSACGGPRPQVVSLSGGALGDDRGTDARARKADDSVWTHRQAWVVCAGNNGPNTRTLWTPGVAKNVITVGNVEDSGEHTASIWDTSSRGPTGDGRMKPNVVATGAWVTSAKAGSSNKYFADVGCSMATPHVSGIAATLLEHYPEFVGSPQLLRAHLMATALLHDDDGPRSNTRPDATAKRYTYGLGRVSPYVAHWQHVNEAGWRTERAVRVITQNTWGYLDVDVPDGARRLVAVLTWDEPAASAGAPRAVQYDLDLWVDQDPLCDADEKGQCGEWSSKSYIDNVEYVIIDDPKPGLYRLKAVNWHAPRSGVPAAISALIVNGSMHPDIDLSVAVDPKSVAIGGSVSVVANVASKSWLLSGVFVQAVAPPVEVELQKLSVTRQDGKTMNFAPQRALALGTIPEGLSQSATWTFKVKSPGPIPLHFRATSENGGTRDASVVIQTLPIPTPMMEAIAR